MSTEELDALAESNAALPMEDRIDVEYHASVVYQSIVDINNLVQHSDYYVWLISDDLYNYMLRTSGGENRFLSLENYVENGKTVNYYKDKDGAVDTRAVYLKDLGISGMGNLSSLPEDTLVVLRAPSVLDRNDMTGHDNSVNFIKKILNY